MASRSNHAMWLESAGGGLRVSSAGKWMAAMNTSEAAYVDAERRAMADLIWQDEFGDRHTSMTVLVCGAAPAEILDALDGALLTDAELARPMAWKHYDDPFGGWHEDPCGDAAPVTTEIRPTHGTEEAP